MHTLSYDILSYPTMHQTTREHVKRCRFMNAHRMDIQHKHIQDKLSYLSLTDKLTFGTNTQHTQDIANPGNLEAAA